MLTFRCCGYGQPVAARPASHVMCVVLLCQEREEVLSSNHTSRAFGESFTLNVSPPSIYTKALMKRKRSRSAKVSAPRTLFTCCWNVSTYWVRSAPLARNANQSDVTTAPTVPAAAIAVDGGLMRPSTTPRSP